MRGGRADGRARERPGRLRGAPLLGAAARWQQAQGGAVAAREAGGSEGRGCASVPENLPRSLRGDLRPRSGTPGGGASASHAPEAVRVPALAPAARRVPRRGACGRDVRREGRRRGAARGGEARRGLAAPAEAERQVGGERAGSALAVGRGLGGGGAGSAGSAGGSAGSAPEARGCLELRGRGGGLLCSGSAFRVQPQDLALSSGCE